MLVGYFELAMAIFFGMIGTTYIKLSDGFKNKEKTIIAIVAYIICYYTFAKCMQQVNLCIAYATWSAIGIIASAIIGMKKFMEPLSRVNKIGIGILLVGVILMNIK